MNNINKLFISCYLIFALHEGARDLKIDAFCSRVLRYSSLNTEKYYSQYLEKYYFTIFLNNNDHNIILKCV